MIRTYLRIYREQVAEIIVRMAQVGPDGPTGGYFDAEGVIPW